MKQAKNNIIVKIENADQSEYAVFNPISGCFDIMDEAEHAFLTSIENDTGPSDLLAYMIERGYAYNSSLDEQQAIKKALGLFNLEIASSQVQLMLVPTYGCNLSCTYCFQQGIEGQPTLISKETVDAFFSYAGNNFSNGWTKPFITLFGGEPLINSKAQREIINYIIDSCVNNDYELSVVTNGYDLESFVDNLKKVRIKEIQVTLGGSKNVHDSRRATANKKGTFDNIIKGIGSAISAGMPINLRSVIDAENITDLVALAELLDQKGWLDLPEDQFKTQIGRNYELFECYAKPQHLMTQVELWAEFAGLSQQYPVLKKFHQPDFKGIKYVAQAHEMYMASFDTCPACKTEWVFDLYGEIYGCTASCGRKEFLLGTYWPKVSKNEQDIQKWQSRNVLSIPECKDCKYDVICGGGCGVVAARKNNGNILTADCRPVQQLLELGVNYYTKEIQAIADPDNSLTTRPDIPVKHCSCS